MPAEPSVSIVVLNWNGKHHLESCLGSLSKLDYPESKLELILCDNGSSDGSVEFARAKFPQVKVIALDRNYGFAEGNDRAAQQAGGEWVGFLNNDMWVKASWLQDMLSALEERPEAACIASKIVNWDGSALDFVGGGVNFMGQAFQLDYGKKDSPHDRFRRLLFACGGAMLIQRELFLKVGGFDPDFFAFFEDVDLGWRLNVLGHDVWYTPRATAYHRHHGTARRIQSQRLRTLTERNALATIYKCFDDDNLAVALPAALMLLNERALLIAKLDVNSFKVGDRAGYSQGIPPPALRATSPPSGEQSSEGIAAPALHARSRDTGESTYPALSFPGKVMRVVRQEGWGAAFARAGHRTIASIVDALISVLNRFGDHTYRIPGVSASHYAALSQFAHQLDSLNEKRAWIQSRRRRSDAEIVALFQDPFYPGYDNERYIDFLAWLSRVQGLDGRFDAAPD
jgi:GT2 family glycosyltransferase